MTDPTRTEPAADPRRRVVIVEDDAGVAALERRALERRGFDATIAGSASAAIELARSKVFDCWLIDQGLPDRMSGLDLIEQLRRLDIEGPFLLVTGFEDEATLIQALRAGVRDFVRKGPDFLELLVSRVESILATVRIENDLRRSRLLAETEQQRRQELEAEIAERQRAERRAHEALQQLQEQDRRKDEFLAMLGHELRNPLAPVGSAVEVLRPIAEPNSSVEWAVGVISRQLTQMRRIVDDLLDVARIRSGRFELECAPVDPREVLDHAVERSLPAIDRKCHRLRVACGDLQLGLVGDSTRLVQAIANLLDNAAKYTPPGGDILAEVRQVGQWLEFSVTDSGPGLAADELEKVFDLFVQGDRDASRAGGGLGLGLALVRRVVEMHGGRAWAESAGSGTGCRFVVRLPGADVAVPPEPSPPACHAGPRSRLLVIDDNVDAAESLAILMRTWGFTVDTVYDGREVADAVARFDPHALLLDLGLPGVDGIAVAERVRRMHPDRRRLWIAVTGYGSDRDRERTAATGFDAHLVKPVDLAELRRALAPLLEPEAATGGGTGIPERRP